MAAIDAETTWAGRRLHFVGIGGAGMSGLALIAAALGAQVTGSDRAPSSYTERLVEHGIEPVFGHAAANVPAGAEVVYSTAIAADNPERQAADVELHRADLLAEIAEEFNRYNSRHIEIRGPALRAEKISGVFQSNDPASLVSFMKNIPGVHVGDDGSTGFIVTLEVGRAD